MSNAASTELSMRHLPEPSFANSDTSFSFQIPHGHADLLADEDDFLRDDTLSFDTPGRTARAADGDAPLTLAMLTPKPPSPVRNTRATARTPARASPAKATAGLGNEVVQRRTRALELRDESGSGSAAVGSPVNPKRYAALKAGVEFLLADALEDDIRAPQPSLDMAPLREEEDAPAQSLEPVESANPNPHALSLSPRANLAQPTRTRAKKHTVTDGGITKRVPPLRPSVGPSAHPAAAISSTAATNIPTAIPGARKPLSKPAGPTGASRPTPNLANPKLNSKPKPGDAAMIRPGDHIAPTYIQSGSGGAAERLLQYGQSLIDSSNANPIPDGGAEAAYDQSAHANLNSDSNADPGGLELRAADEDIEMGAEIASPPPPPSGTNVYDAAPAPSDERAPDLEHQHQHEPTQEPLTLSQISPQKPRATAAAAAGPSTRKRRADAGDEARQSKRGKPTPAAEKEQERPVRMTRSRARAPLSTSGPASSSSSRAGPSTRATRAKPASTADGAKGAPRVGAGDSRSARREGRAGLGQGRPARSQASTVPGPAPRSASATTTTAPSAFTFHTAARAASSTSSSQPSANATSSATQPQPSAADLRAQERAKAAVPDFAARHAAALAQSQTFRAAHAPAPTVPHAPALSTTARAKEREAFDAGVRAREAEAERAKEEARRIREEEEEKEMREARRRAVPRAHGVPEWYADAPKRAGREGEREGQA
ncbi:hypothetical protein HWV62_33883 [Athelia sp. TMB]|nr:hypothetical protein HWV62_33883 [Athelia sp. TMB]